MAAGAGYIEFTTGDILTASAANEYLASQVVMVFASASARTSAITSPQEGMISYLKDTDSTEYYSGSAWTAIGGGSSGGMTLISTTPLSGSSTTVGSIPSTYKQLYIVVKGVYQASAVGIGFTLNGDTGSKYNYGWFRQRNSTVAAGYNNDYTSVSGAFESGSSSTAGYLAHMELTIPRYTDTNYVNFYWQAGDYNSTNGNTNYVGSGSYDGTAAVSSFTLVSGGSTFSGGTIYTYGVN